MFFVWSRRCPQEGVSFRFVVAIQGSYQKVLQKQFEMFFCMLQARRPQEGVFLDLSEQTPAPTKKSFKSNLK
jgi:hypothetical protein